MAVLIQEPMNENPITSDWQALLLKLTETTGGLLLVDFTEKQTLGIPRIVQGSRIELNGSFYHVTEDEEITGWTSITQNNIWVYAYMRSAGNGVADFYWSTLRPTFQVAKGGWLHPSLNERAVLSARRISNTVARCKSVFGGMTPYERPIDTTGANIINNTNQVGSLQIEAGWYRVSGRGGNGGNGGWGGNSGIFRTMVYGGSMINGVGQSGRNPRGTIASMLGEFILWLEAGTIEWRPGRTGNNGSPGISGDSGTATRPGAGNGGDGGLGATGEDTLLLNNGKVVAIFPGGSGLTGGVGASGAWGDRWLSSVETNPGGYVVTVWRREIGQRPRNGGNGNSGIGFSADRTGSLSLFVL